MWPVTVIGSLMTTIDSSIVILAILPIAEDLKTDYITAVWVKVAYILVNASLMLSLGRIADICRRKKLYNAGFAHSIKLFHAYIIFIQDFFKDCHNCSLSFYRGLSLQLASDYLAGQRFVFFISIILFIITALMSSARGKHSFQKLN